MLLKPIRRVSAGNRADRLLLRLGFCGEELAHALCRRQSIRELSGVQAESLYGQFDPLVAKEALRPVSMAIHTEVSAGQSP